MTVLIFSHESDLDGLYSAAIGLIRYPDAMTVFLGYGAENLNKMGSFISSKTGSDGRGQVIIADLGLNDDLIGQCTQILSSAKADGWNITWVDHHPWSEAAVIAARQFAELVLDPSGKKCASELMSERFTPGNELGQRLASMAHTMDFFTKDQYLTPVTELIRYYQTFPDFYDRMLELAHKSAKGILWDAQMQVEYAAYSKLRDEAKTQALATMQVRPVGTYKVAYVQSSPYLNSSLFSEEVFAAAGADLAMFYSSKGKVSIRRNNDSISCRDVALKLPDGGGHDYAAGAIFKSDPADISSVIAELEAAALSAIPSK
jgi:oligoribonuclease NrnB/cAMP/cGMP phosphodiesterase (DHH superfamily)